MSGQPVSRTPRGALSICSLATAAEFEMSAFRALDDRSETSKKP